MLSLRAYPTTETHVFLLTMIKLSRFAKTHFINLTLDMISMLSKGEQKIPLPLLTKLPHFRQISP